MIHAYTGDGKGKSTCGLGLLIRAYGAGKRVMMIMFDKGGKNYKHSELNALDKLNIDYEVTGLERMQPDGKFRFGVSNEDRMEAKRGLSLALQVLKSSKYDLIVLDEFLTAISFELLSLTDFNILLETTPKETELVLTGRCRDSKLLDKCDLVTNMTKIKHYYEKGQKARKGIEY